jgi:hypothetical protein
MMLHSREGLGERRPVDVNAIVEESLNLAYHGGRDGRLIPEQIEARAIDLTPAHSSASPILVIR